MDENIYKIKKNIYNFFNDIDNIKYNLYYNALILLKFLDQTYYKLYICNDNYKKIFDNENIIDIFNTDTNKLYCVEIYEKKYIDERIQIAEINPEFDNYIYELLLNNISYNDIINKDNKCKELYIIYKINLINDFNKLKKYLSLILNKYNIYNFNNFDLLINNKDDLFNNWDKIFCYYYINNKVLLINYNYCDVLLEIVNNFDNEQKINEIIENIIVYKNIFYLLLYENNNEKKNIEIFVNNFYDNIQKYINEFYNFFQNYDDNIKFITFFINNNSEYKYLELKKYICKHYNEQFKKFIIDFNKMISYLQELEALC